nr:SDR family oxidoreductase [Knoellia sp. DB2414S]
MPDTVVVAGAARGIGRAIATDLSALGCAVVAVDVEAAVEEFASAGGRRSALVADVTADDTAARVGELVTATEPGTTRLVYAAFTEERAAFTDGTRDGWGRTFEVSVGAAANLLRAFATWPGARSAVLVGSVHARATMPGFSAYAVAKAGLTGLVRAAALELGPLGIRVNEVDPGFVRVERNEHVWSDPAQRDRVVRSYPLGRLAEPRDVSTVVRFLLGDDSAYVTGASIPVDGGLLTQLPENR